MKQALAGLKVADFSWVIAGPLVGRYLVQHGATVVRVESTAAMTAAMDRGRLVPPYKDDVVGVNRSAFWTNANPGKLDFALNLNDPRGKELAKKLVAWSDVVVENFAPGVMARWGLAYDDLVKVKDNIIMVSLSMQGQTGARSQQPGLGYHLGALAGFCHLMGYADGGPLLPYGAYTDYIAPRFGAAAVLAALEYRRRTGRGQYIDLSQYEASVQFLTPAILEYTANRKVATRIGNRHPTAAPHGVYRCHGEDRWCAISIFSDDEWERFRMVMGNPDWSRNERFRTCAARKENEDELDLAVEKWTQNFTAEQVMTMLQAAGLSAGVVQTPEDLFNDSQLQYRGHFVPLEHPEIGTHSYDSPSFRLSETPCQVRRAPLLGENTHYVCTEILGLSDEQFVELAAAGVVL